MTAGLFQGERNQRLYSQTHSKVTLSSTVEEVKYDNLVLIGDSFKQGIWKISRRLHSYALPIDFSSLKIHLRHWKYQRPYQNYYAQIHRKLRLLAQHGTQTIVC